MTGADFGGFLLGLIATVLVVALLLWLLRWLYVRSSKERAFVRTGLGGEKVVLGGGALVLPLVHDVIPVNMNTLRLEVARGQERSLITQDRLRVDVVAEFYVRVQASREAVACAAQTLGLRTLEPAQLKELIEGKFVDALRTVAATMTMEQLHEQRGEFVRLVRAAVAEDLGRNGLELEAASLTSLDQTEMAYFNPSNAFDAEGLTRLTEQIEHHRKARNDIEQNTLVAIRNKNLEVEKQQLDIDREGEYARLSQQREVEGARVRQRTELSRERAEQERDAESVQISARQAVETAKVRADQTVEQARIHKEQALQAAEVARRLAMELAEQQRAIAVAEQSKAQSEAQAQADVARAGAVAAEEKVYTAREVEAAERKKAIELIGAAQAGEKEALRLRLAVEAEKQAATDRGEAIKTQARAEAEAEQIRLATARLRAELDAQAAHLMNAAHNMLSPEARVALFRQKLLDKMEGLIRESARPMERIEGIKILSVNGLGGLGGSGGASAEGDGGTGLPEQVVNSALRFRAQAPLIDSLLQEIGIEPGGVAQATKSLLN
ncbi:MAG: hypothetical protein RLZZ373_1483 [Pseudomonadota bacterium]